jgi:dihydrolipoamide dehydrogenase
VKLIAESGTERVLGVGIVGPCASELIAEATLAVELGASVADLMHTIHAHPTLAEALPEAAELVRGASIHIYKKRR